MAKFIEVASTSGEWFLLNADRILYLHIKQHPVFKDTQVLHQIEVPGRLIEVTEQMFNKVKSQLI